MESKYQNHKLKGIFLWMFPLLVFTALVYYFRLFIIWPPIDIPMHFVGGGSIAAIIFLIYNKNMWTSISSTFGILVLWEIFEMAGWRLFPKFINCAYVFCEQDIFFWDGFFDLIVGMIAAFLVMWLVIRYNNKNGVSK